MIFHKKKAPGTEPVFLGLVNRIIYRYAKKPFPGVSTYGINHYFINCVVLLTYAACRPNPYWQGTFPVAAICLQAAASISPFPCCVLKEKYRTLCYCGKKRQFHSLELNCLTKKETRALTCGNPCNIGCISHLLLHAELLSTHCDGG